MIVLNFIFRTDKVFEENNALVNFSSFISAEFGNSSNIFLKLGFILLFVILPEHQHKSACQTRYFNEQNAGFEGWGPIMGEMQTTVIRYGFHIL